jgi:iron complex transport system ATP-binding protein
VLDGITFVRDGRRILDGVSLTIRPHERWVLLGRNGSGKTSLVRIAALVEHPSSGTVQVLGETLGRTDVRTLRTRVALVSAAMADRLRPGLSAHDVVLTGRKGALEPWWHTYDDTDRAATAAALARFGVAHLAGQAFLTLSSGERQRVMLARAVVNDPSLVVLDEPMAGLDLAGREELVATLAAYARDDTAAPTLLVTHHVDEIPPGSTHLMMLTDGRVLTAGPLEATLTADALSACFGLRLVLERHGERWAARAA